MVINYELILFIYCSIILLLLISIFRDRPELANKIIKSHNWSLSLSIIVIFFLLSQQIIVAFWSLKSISLFEKYPLNPSNLEVFSFAYNVLTLTLVYVLLQYAYKLSVVEVFNLKITGVFYILKLCAILTAINIISLYFLNTNLLLNPQKSVVEHLNSMDMQHVVLFSFNTIILAPIVEESIFRGLIYNPLYRKAGRCFAITLSSLIWTQVHYESFGSSAGIFIVGIFLAWLYDRSGSLIHPIVFHIFKNSWLLVYYFKG